MLIFIIKKWHRLRFFHVREIINRTLSSKIIKVSFEQQCDHRYFLSINNRISCMVLNKIYIFTGHAAWSHLFINVIFSYSGSRRDSLKDACINMKVDGEEKWTERYYKVKKSVSNKSVYNSKNVFVSEIKAINLY